MRAIHPASLVRLSLTGLLLGGSAWAQSTRCEHPISDLSVCPACPSSTPLCRKPVDGYEPTVNGCGPEKFSNLIENGVIPQGYGVADFRNGGCPAAQSCGCNEHDRCYGTCNAEKKACDDAFLQQLYRACAQAYPVDPRGKDDCPDGLCFSSNKELGICRGRARLYYKLVAGAGQSAYDAAQKDACQCCCNPQAAHLEARGAMSLASQVGLVCTPPDWVGTSSSVISDATPLYRISASVTWKYDPTTSSGTIASYRATGTVTFVPTDACTTVTPSTYSVTLDSPGGVDEMQIDYSTDPPTYNGAGASIWAATYTDTCHGGSSPAAAGGAWFQGQGQVSADGATISGHQSASGQTFDFTFTAR